MAWLKRRHNVWWVYNRVRGKEKRQRIGTNEAQAREICRALNAGRKASRTAEDLAQMLEAAAAEVRVQTSTLADLAKDYLAAKAVDTKASTRRGYKTHLDRFAAGFSGTAWRGLTLGRVNGWLSNQPAAAGTARTLKAFGHYLHGESVWRDNPLMRLKVKAARGRRIMLSENEIEETEKALGKAAPHLLGPFYAGIYAGLRADEICHLRLENIDRQERTLLVAPVAGWSPKNWQERKLPLHPKLLAEIREGDRGWAFVQVDGQAWTRHSLWRDMRRHGRCALHVLRHTFISRVMLAGAPDSVARDLAGHSSTTVTSGYAHTVPKALREAIDRL